MNDDEPPMTAEMASAYLDGELDAADRAGAAADPDTMAMVDSFARIRAALGEVGPVAGSARAAAMAAALAEFDAVHVTPTVTPTITPAPARVTSLPSRRMRVYWLLPGLAAAAIAVVIGTAALDGTQRDDGALTSATLAAPARDAATELPASKSAGTIAAASAETAAAEAGAPAADSAIATVPAIDSDEALALYASSSEAQTSSSLSTSSITTEAPLAATGPAPIANEYPLPACLTSNEIVLGAITYRGIPAFAVRDALDGTVQAIDALDCDLLASVGP